MNENVVGIESARMIRRTLERSRSREGGWGSVVRLTGVDYKALDLIEPKAYGDGPARGSMVLALDEDDKQLDAVADAVEKVIPPNHDESVDFYCAVHAVDAEPGRVFIKAKAPKGGLPPVLRGGTRVDERLARAEINGMERSGTLAAVELRFKWFPPMRTAEGGMLQGVTCLLCGIENAVGDEKMPV